MKSAQQANSRLAPVVVKTLEIVPEAIEIWFHGSRVTGKATAKSDWDLLVVVPDSISAARFIDLAAAGGPLHRLGTSVPGIKLDVQPAKSLEFAQRGSVAWWAREEGRRLWSRAAESQAQQIVQELLENEPEDELDVKEFLTPPPTELEADYEPDMSKPSASTDAFWVRLTAEPTRVVGHIKRSPNGQGWIAWPHAETGSWTGPKKRFRTLEQAHHFVALHGHVQK